MKTTLILIKRNIKLFFRDKALFLTSLITPAILLVLYATFLGKVYRDSFIAILPEGIELSDRLLSALVSGQMISSILSVSCVTVAFSSNFLSVQDKALGRARDLSISPVKGAYLSVAYYTASLISTLIICLSAVALCLIYVAFAGWYLSISDVFMIIFDVILLVLFATAISSVVNFFLETQGQISAVGSMVSSTYGFISGAYMPISSFGAGLRQLVALLPGTHATSLLRRHSLGGVFAELEKGEFPSELTDTLCDLLDCNLYLRGEMLPAYASYIMLIGSTALLILIYVTENSLKRKKKHTLRIQKPKD